MVVSKQSIPVAGLEVTIYKDDSLNAPTNLPVTVLFILHGRQGSAKDADKIADHVFDHVSTQSKSQPPASARDLVIVAFDQRNHGSRLISALGNEGWNQSNPSKDNKQHAIDMYTIYNGTARDVSFLIDFLPAYLYPNGERQIVEWVTAGVSLGGHATWLVLRNEPRVKIGIPIIGCPDYLKLMSIRANENNLSLDPPYMPDSLKGYIQENDPAATPHAAQAGNPFWGKSVLVLSGKIDKLVQWEASADFVDALNVGPGEKRVVVEATAGHEVTPAMLNELAAFVWRRAIVSASPSL
ncbi:hypothetical protein SISSUDRAFT_1125905 [Sistotremastrum suecicum HHB10207 ss-3]|uniref:Alpha/beta-hydrolase n=1 Tax=Sistotremastrum suecicum HHB10207 ss-3 TaxID=1314776 RepID=A0A166H1P9_9AGAM|nr:hypothetical protein SISSUDRAFT_1125905 [Sistotremastrum suecicum HHB10207 ss-3]